MNKTTRRLVNGLLKVLAVSAVISVGVVAPNALLVVEKILNTKDHDKLSTEYKRLLRHMKRLDLITIDSGSYITLTDKGKERLEEASLEEIFISTPKKWDGLWRVVAFDIPQEKRVERNEFLEQLRRLGFVRSLQSMWVFPFPCTQEIAELARVIGIEKNVMILESKVTEDRHRQLLKFFKKTLTDTI